jgi:la-related protein 1
MFLRKHMDTKGFVFLNFIADFNRIKSLTTDLEMIKMVCYNSKVIEYNVGNDGKDRLRRIEGWEQWVLPVAQRDSSAQNDGPDELFNPPMPHPHGFDPNGHPQYPGMPVGSPTGPMSLGPEAYPAAVNGFHPGASQHVTASAHDTLTNGTSTEGVNGTAIPNGQPIDASNAVSGEPDSFSDKQIESLTVVVRNHDQFPMTALPLTTRTYSNGSISSRTGFPDESGGVTGCQTGVKANDTSLSEG